MIHPVSLLILPLSLSAFAAEEPAAPAELPNICRSANARVAKVCTKEDEKEPKEKFARDCAAFNKQVLSLFEQLNGVKARCKDLGEAASAKGADKAKPGQREGNTDTRLILEQNDKLLRECATALGSIEANLKSLASIAESSAEEVGEANSLCKRELKRQYLEMKKQAEGAAEATKTKAAQYVKAANEAAGLGDKNKNAETKAKSENPGPAGGSSGGGTPQIPQLPQQKDNKAEEEAKAKALRQAQCKNEQATRRINLLGCYKESKDCFKGCDPSHRVKDVCDREAECKACETAVNLRSPEKDCAQVQ